MLSIGLIGVPVRAGKSYAAGGENTVRPEEKKGPILFLKGNGTSSEIFVKFI